MSRPKHPSQRTYTTEQKIALVTEIDRRYRAGGGGLDTIARALGTSSTSYRNWVAAGVRPRSTPAMRPVEITAMVPVIAAAASVAIGAPLVLVTLAGHRIEGLSVETAAALVRALS